MIAEIHGKISSSGSNLSDRLEDKLTGDVFGALRYVPAEVGLLKILNAVRFGDEKVDFSGAAQGYIGDRFHFWVYDKNSELDLTVELPDCVIGIEVKYNSGLSSDDGRDFGSMDETDGELDGETERMESAHQLNREAETLTARYKNKKKYLVFIARRAACKAVYADVTARGWHTNKKGVPLGILGWEDVLETVKRAAEETQNPYQKRALDDIVALLKRKGFEDFLNISLDGLPVVEKEYFAFDWGENASFFVEKEMKTVLGDGYYEFR